MKKILLFVLVVCSSVCMGQNYRLFNSSSKKLFSEYPINQNGYSISFDSVRFNGNDSVYYNFGKLNSSTINGDTCHFWVGPQCNQLDQATWIGKQINTDTSFSKFYTLNNDSLSFNFTTNPIDTITFYSDLTQNFLMVYENDDTLSILNNIDSARSYKIIHTDLSGNIINSNLNNQKIILSKNYGLVRFFQVDSFPQILKPLTIVGNTNPTGGLFQITNEMLYDYQPGDEIQYHEYYLYANFSYYYYDRYRKYTILNRTTTSDSLIYQVQQDLFYVDSTPTFTSTIVLRYYRSTLVANIPFELFNGHKNSLWLQDFCGTKRWRFNSNAYDNDWGYCLLDNCWGHYDVGGWPYDEDINYVPGLGIYSYWHYHNFNPGGYEQGSNSIVYYKKNGILCGPEVMVGINEQGNNIPHFSVYPNPTTSSFTINLNNHYTNVTVEITNVIGQVVYTLNQKEVSQLTINLNEPKGLYFVRVMAEGSDGLTEVKQVMKLVKE